MKSKSLSISENDFPVHIEKCNSDNLLVCFGGLKHELGIPQFEFYNTIKDISCDKFFFRDFNQFWYQKGVSKELHSISTFCFFLKQEIEKGNYKKVSFIGNSMGGYAAILLGKILEIDEVISISPQTFIDRKIRISVNDNRWEKELKKIYQDNEVKKIHMDLKALFIDNNGNTVFNIYYSKECILDSFHAERLGVYKNVNLNPYNFSNHNNLVKILRDNGELKKIIENIYSKRII